MSNRSLTRQAVLAALMSLYAGTASALTSVVLVRTAREIAVAADSKGIFIIRGRSAVSTEVCKIRRSGHVYFSIANVIVDNETGLDAYRTAEQAAHDSTSIEGAAEMFRKLITPYLAPTVADLQHNDPVLYREAVRNGSLLEALFFGVEEKVPIVVMVTFAVIDWDATAPSIVPTEAVHRESGNAVNFLWIGSIDVILRAMHDQGWRQVIAGLPPPQAAFALVNMAMQADPSVIAPPIDVLQIRGNHARWVRREHGSKCRAFR